MVRINRRTNFTIEQVPATQASSQVNNKKTTLFSKIGNAVHETVRIVKEAALPVITGTTISAISYFINHSAVSKIVGGVGCTLSGGYLLRKSKVIEIVKNQVVGAKEEQLKVSGGRVTAATAGAILAVYGIASMVLGVKELLYGSDTLIQPLTGSAGEITLVKDYTREMFKCPEIVELWQKAVKEGGAITIAYAAVKDFPHSAGWLPEQRQIVIRDDVIEESKRITMTLFELCNAHGGHTNTGEISAKCSQGDINLLEYTKQIMEIEFRSMKCHHTVITKCVQSQKWDSRMILYHKLFETSDSLEPHYEIFWDRYFRHPAKAGHRELFRKQWQGLCKPTYCQKHPQAEECVG
ncbi:MAG: hypothetical protein JWO53_1293 [Chlamydiia bacterium]|nr:hypothetical protein [Chlamydiia bacterium]